MTGDARNRLDKLEAVLSTLEEVIALTDRDAMTRRIAQGFCELGAIISVILVRNGDRLEITARWPVATFDALFESAVGLRAEDFSIPLSDADNPYVVTLLSRQPRVLRDASEVVEHVMRTYRARPESRAAIAQALTGKAAANLPLIAGDRAVGIVGLNYRYDFASDDLNLFNIFARSAGILLDFKREVLDREAVHAENQRLLKELEELLEKERRQQAELTRTERLAALGEMSAVVAHEIRNPLGVIANSIATLERHIGGHPECRLLLDIVGEETRRINRIVDDMLTFSRPMEPAPHGECPADLMERAIFLSVQDPAYHPAICVEYARASGMPAIHADPHLVTQALVNLLLNAFQAMSAGGKVTISTRQHSVGGLDYLEIAVRDTGPGIAAEHLEHVFKPFYTTRTMGTGLGLTIVKRVVDTHRGILALESEPGRGTVVRVSFPIVRDE